MKKLIKIYFLLFTIIISQNTYAEGFFCEAFCVSIDSSTSTLYLVDHLQIEAGVSKKRDAHNLLKKKCRRLSNQLGYRNSGLIVDQLNYSSSHFVENENTSSSSSNRVASATASIGSSMTASGLNLRRGRRRHLSRFGISNSAYAHSSSSLSIFSESYNHERDTLNNTLDIELINSDKEVSCEYDEDIISGNIPYIGNIRVL
ncbi:MAG: hypothetical protein N4A33_05905 [Bacteriovoracaceae bacterium]|jgi:hypothetical protein|nr:hypothetical protein [Bacteriovoracaceae bacterium]